MPRCLSFMPICWLIIGAIFFAPSALSRQVTYSNQSAYQSFSAIFYHDSLSNEEKYLRGQALSFDISPTTHPRVAALLYLQLMFINAQTNDGESAQQWRDKLATLTLPKQEQQVVNFLINLYQMELHRVNGEYIIAISEGENLKQQLANFNLQAKRNFVNNTLFVKELDKAILYNSLGISYFKTSDYREAQQHFIDTMELYEKADKPSGKLAIYNNLSMISWAQQNYLQAISLMNQSLALSKQLNNEQNYLRGLSNLGIYYSAAKNYDNALASFQKVFKHESIDNYPKIKIQTLLAKAETLQAIDEFAQSETLIQQALLLSTRANDKTNISMAKVSLANLLSQQNKYQQALAFYLEAIEHFREMQLAQEAVKVLLKISQLYQQQGQYDKALTYFEQYNNQSIELLKSAQESSITNLHERFEKQNREKQIQLLEKENQLNTEAIKVAASQQKFTLYLAIAVIVILFLLLNRYYNKIQARRLALHNKEIAANEKQLLLLSHAFSNTADAVWITNEHFEIEAVNNAYVLQTHKTRIEVIGKKIAFAHVNGQDEAFTKRILLQAKLEETWHGELYEQRSDNEVFPLELDIEAIKNDNNEIIHYLGVFRDITDRKKSEQQLARLVTHDDLTGLPNRTLLDQLIKQSCLNSKHSHKTPTLLLLDVNGFKKINDSFGHAVGDTLIHEIANRLKNTLYRKDVIAHINGAEFCILAELNEPKRSAVRVAQKILSIFDQPFNVNDSAFNLTASMGITVYPDDSDNPQGLLKKAAIAMLDVKNTENHNYRFFEARMNNEVANQLEQEQKLLNAINNQYFEYYYQPLVNTQTGEITGAEALIRWIEPNGEIVSPQTFIPLAEQAGFIDQIDRHTINSVFEQVALWVQQNTKFGAISINISAQMFTQSQELITLLQAKLSQFQINPQYIKIEITESMLLNDIEMAISTMDQIKKLGFQLALDDFGTGFSSLNYLKRFPIDVLKIDRSFIMGMHESEVDQSIVKSIVSLAHTLKLTVVGEGVELAEHLDELQKMHCEEYQGYLYSKPIPSQEFEQLLATKKNPLQP